MVNRGRACVIVTPITHKTIHKTGWDVYTNENIFPGLTVWDVHTNGNVFPGLTVWDVHKNGNVFLGLTVWNVHNKRKRLFGTDCVGCTYDRNRLGACIIVFDRSPVTHDLILPSVCARRAYPRRFLGRVGRTLLSPTLTWRRFQMPSRKGVKNRLFRTDAHQ